MARPSALTPAVASAISEALAGGSSADGAARRAGISLRTLRRWLARGSAGEEPFAALVAAFSVARNAADRAFIESILAHARASGELVTGGDGQEVFAAPVRRVPTLSITVSGLTSEEHAFYLERPDEALRVLHAHVGAIARNEAPRRVPRLPKTATKRSLRVDGLLKREREILNDRRGTARWALSVNFHRGRIDRGVAPAPQSSPPAR